MLSIGGKGSSPLLWALPGESSLEGECLLQCMRRVGVNYFLRELALSCRGAVCHTCHDQVITTCIYRLF